MPGQLGIDCGSISLNLALFIDPDELPITIYRRTRGRPLATFVQASNELIEKLGEDLPISSAMVTGSARELVSQSLGIPAVNEISAHSTGVHHVAPDVRTIIEIGGQDSKFIKIEPSASFSPRVSGFRMNEICAAGTGAFLDEQAERLAINVESFGSLALRSQNPARIAGRCAVFAKTDMIHQAQEGAPIPDILLGLAFGLVRNYISTLIRGEEIVSVVALQGGVMNNQAVVKAFRVLLHLDEKEIIIPPYFDVLGAVGAALLAARTKYSSTTLAKLKTLAEEALNRPLSRYFLPRLKCTNQQTISNKEQPGDRSCAPPLIMGLDIGSVSAKGVMIDNTGQILRQDYRLSRSRPIDTLAEVVRFLTDGNLMPDIVAVTGSGRYLQGKLLDADLIINEISAQAEAAISYDPQVDTIVEIGGQDSKWIALENGDVRDFEMNRVCAAGTGSFLMAQAQHLNMDMGKPFSDAAFSSTTPADLGTRCTVFMESDLIHHQNTGATPADLAAGVCISIVQNYLERVANHKSLGNKVVFLGGVAGTPAVKAAFEQTTGRTFDTPQFYKVSGALGAALKALRAVNNKEIVPKKRTGMLRDADEISREPFNCNGCTNQCRVYKYKLGKRTVFNGGLCERWEFDDRPLPMNSESDPFNVRKDLLQKLIARIPNLEHSWGMVRSPYFFEWYPFWTAFFKEMRISLVAALPPDRTQFEGGARFLSVETCLPMKILAGQIKDLVDRGQKTIFHPSILNTQPCAAGDKATEYCPYIQSSSQFFKGTFDVEWFEFIIGFSPEHAAFRRDHLNLARGLGISRREATAALNSGFEQLANFQKSLRNVGEQFLGSLGFNEKALVVLGKPYHTTESFLNMNIGRLFQRLGIKAIPSDIYPLRSTPAELSIYWKHQGDMIRVAREIADDSRLFPVFITFFGCGPDPFTLRHIRDVLGGKPLLVLEMDEHSSTAGITTRIEAFLDQIKRYSHASGIRNRSSSQESSTLLSESVTGLPCGSTDHVKRGKISGPTISEKVVREVQNEKKYAKPVRPERLYVLHFCDHSYGFAAAARSMGIDAHVLPRPDEESEKLGRPHSVGGECHPYLLVLGDYIKLAQSLAEDVARKSLVYMIGPNACRVGQYPVYMEKVRQELGFSTAIIEDVNEGLKSFGFSERNRQRVLLRAWEGLNVYDLLFQIYLRIRPTASDRTQLDRIYENCCRKMFDALSEGRIRSGIDEVLHDLYQVSVTENGQRPRIAVTGDYYTRVVPFANNQVYDQVESLGATIWPPPTLSDSFKMSVLRDIHWNLGSHSLRAAENAIFYTLMAASEFRVKGARQAKKAIKTSPSNYFGFNIWKNASRYIDTRLPAGITAPIATTIDQLDSGADGVLNLMTLNCLFATVVTATLSRALKEHPEIPMLTLIYDGLKKTNEKTRVEAFMDQVWDHFYIRSRFHSK
ncbi:MAG: acyl-CoA dehydratase activase [Desulfomonilaceae bacterium]